MGTEVPSSEARLIGRARRGDVQAFGRLVELNKDYIFNAVFHLLGNAVDAEDISQEVFLRAFRHLNDFEGRARFRTWLYGIMLNAVRSFWRRRTLRGTVSLDGGGEGAPLPDPPGPTDGPDAAADRRERVEAVRAAIGALDEESREIVVLRDIKGLAYEELAEVLRIPVGTVKSRLHRARTALRKALEPLYGAEQKDGPDDG
ncbi:MAG: sigma-70 family RNA polymerase sigma factor [Candidatus Brocadiaceae bacterium]|nr:sigma-70 family RNA polymerase sigma factor [Candidatus Brocadiaceae bacterium]